MVDAPAAGSGSAHAKALRLVILIGLLSFFADFTYEGSRSIVGSFLAVLGAAAFAPLVFLGGFWPALVGAGIWGLGMGVHESVIPAAVAPMVAPHRRASAFGLFTGAYGTAWFLGSGVIGLLYDRSLAALVGFCVVTQLAAVPLYLWVAAHAPRRPAISQPKEMAPQ